MGIWRWRALRRPVALALGMATVVTVGVGDTGSSEQLALVRLERTSESPQARATAAPPPSPVKDAPAARAAPQTPSPTLPARGRETVSQQAAPPSPKPASESARAPEGASPNLPASEVDAYLPTEARLLVPKGSYASVGGEVRIGFDLPVRNRTVFEQSFQIDPAAPGRLDWVNARTLRYRPQRLAFATTYRVGVAEPATGRDWRWTFSTMRKVTFTFDDCPASAAGGQDLLAFLRQRHLHAIAFPTGQCSGRYPWLVPALLADGHTVCNHTLSHANLPRLTDDQMAAEIAGGVHAGCNLLRPPYGAWDGPGGRVERIAAQQGYRLQFWDVDTLDWTGLGSQAISSRIYEGGGGVVLMHFHGRHTLEALKQLDVAELTGQQ